MGKYFFQTIHVPPSQQPEVFIGKILINLIGVYLLYTEISLVRNNLIAIIPWMSTEWSISFEYRMTGRILGYFKTILHFTNDGNGHRAPAVFMTVNSNTFHFTTALNENSNYAYNFHEVLQLNRVYKVEIHQRYISNGNYRYFIKVDGEQVHSAVNTKAKQCYNVKVYTGNPWYDVPEGFISNLKFTNFF